MLKKMTEWIGAALMASALLLAGWFACHGTPAPDVRGNAATGIPQPKNLPSPWDVGQRWDIDLALRTAMLAQLPAAFERRAREARDKRRDHVVPPLSAYVVHFQGETRAGGKRMVTLSAECTPAFDRVASPPAVDPAATPEPARVNDACFFSGAYDPDQRRYVDLTIGFPAYEPFAQVDCGRDRFQAVTSLAALPAEVLSSLQGTSPLADSGAAFQVGDVVGPERLPMRRLAWAAVAVDRAVVAVQHGGFASGVDVWLFERQDGHWDGQPRWQGGEPPTSTQALLNTACLGVPAPPSRGFGPADLIFGFEDTDGSLRLILVDEQGPGYILRHHPGAADDIASDSGIDNKPLSAQARRALRKHLLALRAELLPDQPAYGYVSKYLKTLELDSATSRR